MYLFCSRVGYPQDKLWFVVDALPFEKDYFPLQSYIPTVLEGKSIPSFSSPFFLCFFGGRQKSSSTGGIKLFSPRKVCWFLIGIPNAKYRLIPKDILKHFGSYHCCTRMYHEILI